ncbi:ECF-type riboflavin transporter substrate-binding protein [Lacticaseibacillus parakribbianus]|uniref:ECF-type riboflavin transporter substrate-binding protein n=1 Tax=Lacticaseibacillus parakribbianus TaxID=2970927 RepID=UPI0021CB6D84|nr:ECF-type riboflavin transporter substrate-binding protein [Lacticaseibacillus parakribbianus]
MNNKRNTLSVKTVVAIGIGTAIIFILKRWVSIPSGIPNTNIDTSYGFLGFFSILFGPIAGFVSGFLGHALTDFTAYGSPWWTWVFTTGLVGGIIGLFWKRLDVTQGDFGVKKILAYNSVQILTNFGGWAVVAPTLDVLVYSEPANKVYLQGIVSAISNSVSAGVIGTILLVAYAATRTKKGSLKKE